MTDRRPRQVQPPSALSSSGDTTVLEQKCRPLIFSFPVKAIRRTRSESHFCNPVRFLSRSRIRTLPRPTMLSRPRFGKGRPSRSLGEAE